MKIFYDNLINSSVLIPSSLPVAQDVNKLKIAQLANNFTFLGNDENLVIQFDTPTTIENFIVDIGNLSGNGTYLLEGNDTDVWISPSYSEPLIVTDSALYLIENLTFRYYRLKIIDIEVVNGISLGYIQLGGKSHLQLPGINPGVTLNYNTSSSGRSSESGQFYGNIGYEYLETKFSFPNIREKEGPGFLTPTVAGRVEILEVWNTIQNVHPFWVFLWSENLDEHPPVFAVLKQKKLTMKKLPQSGKIWSTSLNIKQIF